MEMMETTSLHPSFSSILSSFLTSSSSHGQAPTDFALNPLLILSKGLFSII